MGLTSRAKSMRRLVAGGNFDTSTAFWFVAARETVTEKTPRMTTIVARYSHRTRPASGPAKRGSEARGLVLLVRSYFAARLVIGTLLYPPAALAWRAFSI